LALPAVFVLEYGRLLQKTASAVMNLGWPHYVRDTGHGQIGIGRASALLLVSAVFARLVSKILPTPEGLLSP
jgi:hypothetical protein